MNKNNLEARISELEKSLKAASNAGIWVDMFDNKLRIDINHKRGEELTFPTVKACAEYLEKTMKAYEKVSGLVFVANTIELFEEMPPTYIPDEMLRTTGVVMNLFGHGQDSLADMAAATMMSRYKISNPAGNPQP